MDAIVERKDLISQKYPKLSPFQGYIPPGDDLEEYEENAKSFAETLKVYNENFLEGQVEGASPPPPSQDEEIDETEEDRLWSIVASTAGVQGKEEEYNKALEKWQAIQLAKQTN